MYSKPISRQSELLGSYIETDETYFFCTAMSREAGYHYWLDERVGGYATASPGGRVLGTCGLVPNQVRHGHYVPKASRMVTLASQGAGWSAPIGQTLDCGRSSVS